MKYFKVIIDHSSKAMFSKEPYRIFDRETKVFETLEQVKTFLANEYPKCKKEKMYIDDKQGNSHHIGWIYSFKNRDISHNSETWLQQDWVNVNEIESKRIVL